MKSDIQRKSTYGTAIPLAPLINFLFDHRAFGYTISEGVLISSVPKLAVEMYEDVPSDSKFSGNTSTLPLKRERKQKNYGINRLENLKAGYPCTSLEADWFYWAFEMTMGYDWVERLSPETLVTTPLLDLFDQARTHGLGWPEKLDAVWRFQSIITTYANSNLSLRLKVTGIKAGISANADVSIVPSDGTLQCPVDTLYFLELDGLRSGESVFLVELYDQLVDINDKVRGKQVFPQRLIHNNQNHVPLKITHADQAEFVIADLVGGFQYCVVCFPSSWDFEDVFDCSPYADAWDERQCRHFITALEEQLAIQQDRVRVTELRYRVPSHP